MRSTIEFGNAQCRSVQSASDALRRPGGDERGSAGGVTVAGQVVAAHDRERRMAVLAPSLEAHRR